MIVYRLSRCRYMRLYNAAIKDSAFGYAVFFACFMGHLVFVGWSAIGERQQQRGGFRCAGVQARPGLCCCAVCCMQPSNKRRVPLHLCRLSHCAQPRPS